MQLYMLFLFLVSRPSFLPFWLIVRKLSAHAMNMSAASRLPCDKSGERIALRYVLAKASQGSRVVIFDVGANVGQYTEMCLKQLKLIPVEFHIYSFEPTSVAAEILQQRFHSEQNVHVVQLGLANQAGERSVYIPWQTCPGASLHRDSVHLWPNKFGGELIEERAVFDTVDNLVERYCLPGIHLLKIDVEGTDFNVIEGARKTIKSGAVRFIQFEVSMVTLLNKTCLFDFWRELSPMYRFFLIMNQGLAEITSYSPHLENFVGASNFLCELTGETASELAGVHFE